MKLSLVLSLAVSLDQAFANIPVNYKVTLSCDRSSPHYTGCLRGMQCTDGKTCAKPSKHIYPQSFYRRKTSRARSLDELIARAYSPDGKCGPSNGGLTCDPHSTVYTLLLGKKPEASDTPFDAHPMISSTDGVVTRQHIAALDAYLDAQPPCVSLLPQHLDQMVVAAQAMETKPAIPMESMEAVVLRMGFVAKLLNSRYSQKEMIGAGLTSISCLASNGCQNGCTGGAPGTGTTAVAASGTGEPVLGKPSTAPATGPDTTDGTCGAGNGNTVCGNWPQGACCSLYGFCGKTTAHCGNGCQSGPCTDAPQTPAPGPSQAPAAPEPGIFKIVGQSGVPAMHAGLLPNGRVVFLDKVENYTQIKLSDGQFAYSAEYDPATNTAVGLSYKTNAFCSGGAFLADGRFVSLGGNAPLADIDPTVGNGFTAIRYLDRSSGANTGQSWNEPGNKLSSARWYASAQTMPDGTVFVASGSLNGLDPTVPTNNNPTYEILNSQGVSSGKSVLLEILNKNQPYYMYPFIHLLNNGNLFIFVAKSAEIFNVAGNQVVTALPDLPGDFRTYPNTGGSVLLPLSSANNWAPDIVICGGGAYQDITSPTDPSCGRIQPLSANPTWSMESMPTGRGMVEGTLLPDGTVIWLNGCNQGAQGFGLATAPTLEALIYNPAAPAGQRFQTGASSTIARLYHSVALLLLDGTMMIAGSNPVQQPVLTPVPNQTPSEDFVTEFRVEIYTPPYLQGNPQRPNNVVISSKTLTANGSKFTITFNAPAGNKAARVALYHGGYVTHSLHMNHRMLFLDNTGYVAGATSQKLTVTMPPNTNIAQPGPYVVYVTCDNVPAIGQFVMVS